MYDDIMSMELFTEDVFLNGRETVAPIVEKIQVCKNVLEEQIQAQDRSMNGDARKPIMFDPETYWRSDCFRELEDTIREIFGFRNVEIAPYIEGWSTEEKDFESKELNAFIYPNDRYQIDGILTSKGFYDRTHSAYATVIVSLGLLRSLEAPEILAVILHEFGHNIDPALVDIKYTETNALTEYLTDRNDTQDPMKRYSPKKQGFVFTAAFLLYIGINILIEWILNKIARGEKWKKKQIDRLKKIAKADRERGTFNRKDFSEAYADNFARMYGYGPELARAFYKMESDYSTKMHSWFKNEGRRQRMIVQIVQNSLKDVHKTDLHRIHALIKDYNDDLRNPNIPAEVKQHMKEDIKQLEEIVNQYLNDFDEFQNRVNRVIYNSLGDTGTVEEDDTVSTDTGVSEEPVKSVD